MEIVMKKFASSGYLFPKKKGEQKEWCKIFYGSERGAFTWFGESVKQRKLFPLIRKSLGIIEVGINSSRITYLLSNRKVAMRNPKSYYNLTVSKNTFNL